MERKIGKATVMIAALLMTMALMTIPKIESGTITPTVSSFLSYGLENSGKHLFTNTVLPQQGPPPPANWVLLATDPDEGVGNNLKTIYGQLYSGVIYFKVEFYRPWTTINDINAGIFMDADRNPDTGLPDGYYPGQNTGIGADYLIIVGYEATAMFKWDPVSGSFDWANPIPLAYLDAPDYTNVFVVGVYLADVQTTGVIDGAVGDIPSDWDWMPDTGHFTFTLSLGGWYYVRTYHPNQWIGGGFPMGWHADDASWELVLPFDFPFYGTYYRTIYISSNGLITFTGPDSSYWNSISELATRLAIAVAWDDWLTYEPFDIYAWQLDSDHMLIRWEVQAYGSSTVANFEVILGRDGVIQIDYGYNDGPVSTTVGVSNGVNDVLAEDLTNLNYINTIVFTPIGVPVPSFRSIAYVYCSWGMDTMQDEMSYLNSLDPTKYSFVWYNEENIDSLWSNLANYRALLIEEDTFYSDPEWTQYGGPIYDSFRAHADELASWIINGGGVFTSGENDLMRSQTWDWLPTGMQVKSYDPELTSSVHIVYDPGLYSTPNVITNSYLSGGHTHAYFIDWDEGYVVTVRRDDNNQPIELFGVFGNGVIVVSHIEAEDMYLAWEYIQNQLDYVSPAYPPWILTIIQPIQGATFYVGDIVNIVATIQDPDTGNPGIGATVTANSPSGTTLTLTETSPGVYETTYQILPTDPNGPWTINVVGVINGKFPKDSVTVNLITPNIHNVAITSIVPSKTVVGQGYNMNVNVTVANQGNFTETFDVTLYAQNHMAINETGSLVYVADYGAGPWWYKPSFPDTTAKWIWKNPDAEIDAPVEEFWVFREFSLASSDTITISITVDDRYWLYVDSTFIGSDANWENTESYVIWLPAGSHKLRITVSNAPGPELNPAGFILSVKDSFNNILFNTQGDGTWRTGVSGLVGYWNFDEGAGTIAHDSSGNNNDGMLLNGPTWVVGKIGKALYFDGTDDYIRIEDSATISSPSVTNAITVMAWVKPDPGFLDRYARVVASHWTDGEGQIGGSSNAWVLEAHDDGRYHAILSAGDDVTWIDLASNTAPQEGVWQHLAFTWDGSTVTFYFNGVIDATGIYTATISDSSRPMQIAKTDLLWYVWKGFIDEVKVYNRSLSAEEVWAEYTRQAGFIIGTQTVTLESGASTTLTFTWNTTGFAKGNYTIWAYAWPVQGETHIEDNTSTHGIVAVTILGDVDGDFDVDILDVVKITAIYASKVGDPQFRPESDIDGDGLITILDVVICTSHYGQKDL
jgi:hypothetical protein